VNRFDLPSNLEAPAIARQLVRNHAVGLVADEVVADAELLVSELVTNAVQHGRPTIILSVCVKQGSIGASIEDQGSTTWVVPDCPVDADATSGRGLMIVGALASQWGIDSRSPDPGKRVWFEL
jgi:anti-sigma regulatory factor (Ser/Thr protein kinase)